jgi:hypothetical protein
MKSKTKKVLIGTGAVAAVVAGGVMVSTAIWPTAPSYAAGVAARHAHFGGPGGWHHGRGHGRGHARGMAMICSDQRDKRIKNGLAFVEGFVNFTPEQTTAWGELTEAIRAGSATIGEKCAEFDKAEMPEAAPEKLERFESLATTGLGILSRIRPAFDRFYATLSDKQKKALDNLMARRGGRRS